MKVVVIDDDPTGSQTVHSCPLLLRWDVDTLRQGLPLWCHWRTRSIRALRLAGEWLTARWCHEGCGH